MCESEKEKLANLDALTKKLDATLDEMDRLRAEHPELFEAIETAFKNVMGRSAESTADSLEFAPEEGRNMFTGKKTAN
jgi:hypothetical protein